MFKIAVLFSKEIYLYHFFSIDFFFKLLLTYSFIHFIFSKQEIFMASIQTCYVYLNMAASPQNQTIYFLVTTLTEANSHWKQFVYCWPTRSSTQRTSFCCVAIMNVPVLTEFMVSMMSVSVRFITLDSVGI